MGDLPRLQECGVGSRAREALSPDPQPSESRPRHRLEDALASCVRPLSEVVSRRAQAFIWEGWVHVYTLVGHASASLAYSWSYPIEGSEKRGFVAVLAGGKIDSPAAAVRAALLEQAKGQSGEE